MKVILSINSGSSSVKVSVYTAKRDASPNQIAEAQISGLTAPPAKLTYSRRGEDVSKDKEVGDAVKSQGDAFKLILDTLINDGELREVSSTGDVAIACHRVVHGGDYDDSQVITKETYHHIDELSDLAPLHNGPALAIVDSCFEQLPDAVNVACFDSQFHATIPPHIATYPIDQTVARNNRLRKYGFHGISYAFIARSVAGHLGKDLDRLNIIALHLGSGASACAIRGGRSWDTSMGLTPLAGLPGATRSGSVDPSLVFHYASDVGKLSPESTKHLHISRAEQILNKESGWKALTGTTDFAAIASAADDGDGDGDGSKKHDGSSDDAEAAARRLAFDLFVDRVCGFVGAYYVSLGGAVDALVFAGGIGERSARLRAEVASRVACIGLGPVDDARNAAGPPPADAGGGGGGGGGDEEAVVWDVGGTTAASDGGPRVLVCQTDEQFEMARSCAAKPELWA